ncbi:response regulator transcription factor [Streptomyces sp. H10-C2]|uniref:response regulator transcription factor n=1 Tax=unclassified Streptomyces TaxID=2593676 RepID=UPI0024B8E842|nr:MULTISPECIES: response regulator transcription factor [unclassified Streptomyces]MDJ0347020.1 response regulator transcription factor [Streptomyces sp. PH10-H1]MDJ0372426.1 response regulator transcription factor [Streptomyces sp. H10-C2]
MRSALAALLGREHDIEVVATPWRNAPRRARSLRTQVCVVDVECPGAAEHDNVAQLTELQDHAAGQECALLVLATASRPGLLRRASQARALGFVNKDAPPEELVRGIRRVATGKRFIDNSLAFDFLQAADIPLTPRELSVLSLAAEGASIGEIARGLHLGNGTVRNYMAAITRKTGARNRVDAIRISRVAGWL